MKKIISFLSFAVIFGLVITIFNSCEKTDKEELKQPNVTNQVPYTLGCSLLSASEYEKVPLAKDVTLKALPSSVALNCPPIGDQGSEGSCTAWGTTYAARSIAKGGSTYTYSTNIFSPEYVYNQIKITDCGSGSYVTRALDLLVAQGACTWNAMPYSSTNGCSTMPNTTQQQQAASNKITGYSRVTVDATSIKTQLANGKAVVVAGPVYGGFMNLGNGQIQTTAKGRNYGGHCYCVVGYDDAKQAFKVQNSWGTSWATAGFGWIAYSIIPSVWSEAYILN
jgi:C1A family cysteine protease